MLLLANVVLPNNFRLDMSFALLLRLKVSYILLHSSNYILPADLLEFGTLVSLHKRSQQPCPRLILDLRLNPLDRDQEVKEQALRALIPFSHILTDNWDSRNTMVDHISVM